MEFKIIKNLEDLPKFIPTEPTFMDIETQDFYGYIRLIQMYQPTTSEVIYILDLDYLNLDEVKELIKPLWSVFHNGSYDFGTLNMTTAKFDDTVYLARSAYPQWNILKCEPGSKPYALDTVIKRLGLLYLYEGLDKKKMQKAGFLKGAYLSNDQYRYSATDVYALSIIWKDQEIQKARELISYKVDILSLGYAIRYQQNGLLVDRKAVRKELDEVEIKIKENEILLNGLNPNSPKQCKEALGTESTDKNVLITLISDGNSIAKNIFEQRRLIKRRGFLISYNKPKVFTKFNPAGAVTGRFTSTGGDLEDGINSQQITRNLQYIFNQDTEDTCVVHADYSTAQLRIAASIMQEPVMYQELKDGLDLHIMAASMVTHKPIDQITKEDRQKGKAVNFGHIFGMSAPSFQEYAFVNYGVIFTLEECKEITAKYKSKYKNIAKYHAYMWENYKKQNFYVATPLGRRATPKLGTDAINIPTQGGEGDMTKLATHYLCKDDNKALNYIYNIVHDAIYMRVPKAEAEYWANLLAKNMKKGWDELCKCSMMYYKDIPMPVEVEYLGITKIY